MLHFTLAISEKMRRQIRGLNQGSENIQDGISLIQVADGALGEVQDILNRMTELSIQAANGTNDNSDRAALQREIQQLSSEINRIGKDTTFNEQHLFDDDELEDIGGSVTNLVSSPAADTGYLTEAIKIKSYWHPSASLDFSNINSKNVKKLNDQSFSFNCSQNCDEVFDITFKTDGTPSSAKNLIGSVTHYYTVDISNCKSGKDVVNAVYDYVKNNLPNNQSSSSGLVSGALKVSHSNELIKSSNGNSLIIYSNSSSYSTEAAAKAKYASRTGTSGKIDCSDLTKVVADEKLNEIDIQCSGNPEDVETICTHYMNAKILGVNNLDISTANGAKIAIGAIKNAHSVVSSQRSELGSYQNRLEHSFNNNKNVEENTTAAESQIRDTNMAEEMVKYSNDSIIAQAGTSVLTQANQQQQQVLSLLGQ